MSIVLNFKDIVDLPQWRILSPAPSNSTVGVSLGYDLRNNCDNIPCNFQFAAVSSLNIYHAENDEWMTLSTPAMAGTFGAGAGCKYFPSAGPSGLLAAGNSANAVVVSTAFIAAVGANQLAGGNSGAGFKIRIIGNSAAGSGKTEERNIIANTLGTTPTITLDSDLSFTPADGDKYEILSGRLYMLCAGATATGIFKAYDLATNSYISLTHSWLPSTIAGDFSAIALDEQYVPWNKNPGEGFFGNLISTGSGGSTITGTAAGGDALNYLNEYRNYQIRIVQDTSIPTAVGQRVRIQSHTAGASPVYTMAINWGVKPSIGATYVIENTGELWLQTTASTSVFTYQAGGFFPDRAWASSTTSNIPIYGASAASGCPFPYTARGTAMNSGCCSIPSYGISVDPYHVARHSYIYSFRGGAAASNPLDLFDLAGGGSGAWTAGITYGNLSGITTELFTTGASCVYDPVTNSGRFGYICKNGTQRFLRFDVKNRCLKPWAYLPYTQGAATVGDKVAISYAIDGNTKIAYLYALIQAGTPHVSVAIST